MVQEYPDGTIICFYGATAEIGGWNGADYLIVNRSDGGPDVFSSNIYAEVNKNMAKKKWGKIGAPKSKKRKAHMRRIAKKR
jgi:hypothetical protein